MYYYDYLFIMEIIEYSKSIVNVYFLPLTWIVGSIMNLISETHYYVRRESMHL